MFEDYKLSKLEILLQQQKYIEAEKLIKDLLQTEPNNIDYLSLFCEVKISLEQYENADEIINTAIGLSPDTSYLFYLKSSICIQLNNYNEAEKNIEEAISLDPYYADYFAYFAFIKLNRKEFEKALELANQSLEIDPECLLGLNTRSSALIKLNKKEEAFETIEGALREDPNDSYTHANYGWGLLEKGNHKKALEHFKESLKVNPNYEYAQSGMLEAIKATNPVYKLFLKYSFWMGNLTSKYQWGVIIGFYIFQKILRAIANSNPKIEPFLQPILILLVVIAISTWIMNPIGNLFLRFNKYGQHLLSKEEKLSSNFVGISFIITVIGVILYISTFEIKYTSIIVYGIAMMLPFSIFFSDSKKKNLLKIFIIALAIIGFFAITISLYTGYLYNFLSIIFIFGFLGFQWLTNYLLISDNYER